MIPTEVALLEKYLAEKDLTTKLMRKIYHTEFMTWQNRLDKTERMEIENFRRDGYCSPFALIDCFEMEIWPEIEKRILS
jgi:hypothetical protein